MSLLEPPIAPRTEFGEELYARLVVELDRPVSSRLGVRTFLLAAAILLVLAGVATGTYVAVHALREPSKRAQVTVVNGRLIVALTPSGPRVLWHYCRVFCGEPEGLDWSPDGRHLAYTLDEYGAQSTNVGLHVVDLKTGRDSHLRVAPPSCAFQSGVDWSPNGRRLAYGCPGGGAIAIIDPQGRHRRLVRPGTRFGPYSPSWSSDGRQIAFATQGSPEDVYSAVYVIGANGGGRHLLVRNAAAPDWSPAGNVIAYEGRDGVHLITLAGRDVTPSQGFPKGLPSFSPDGKQLAIQRDQTLEVFDVHNPNVVTLTGLSVGAIGHLARPAWYPGRHAPAFKRSLQRCAGCF